MTLYMAIMQEIDSYDIDDVTAERQSGVRWASVLYTSAQARLGLLRPRVLTPDEVLKHHSYFEMTNSPLGNRELVSFWLHGRRKVFIGVKSHLETRTEQGVFIVGNTGRPGSDPWVEMTNKMLKSAGIKDYFQRIYFKPQGVSSTRSKLAAISELRLNGHVTHYDDDPRTAIAIAKNFKDVTVVLVMHRLARKTFPMHLLSKYPNIQVVGFMGEMRPSQ